MNIFSQIIAVSLTTMVSISPSVESGALKFYQIPVSSGAPAAITTDQSGAIWFSEITDNRIGMFNPTTERFSHFKIPTSSSFPTDLTVDAKGNIWFAEYDANQLGFYNVAKGNFEEYEIPTLKSQPYRLALDKKGNVWFTQFAGNNVAMFNRKTKKFREYSIPTAQSQPTGIAVDSKGTVWFIETQGNKLGKLIPGQGVVAEHELPKPFSAPNELAIDGEGNIWLGARTTDRKLLRFSPGTNVFEGFELPGKGVTEGLTVDADGNVWYCDKFKNKVGRYSPIDGSFVEIDIAKGDGKPLDVVASQANKVWFTLNGTNRIGVIDGSRLGADKGPELSINMNDSAKDLLKQLAH